MRLPSLNALRAFEAAARHSSFTRAAEQLHVSPGAVSRFVRLLEDDLGAALFERLPNGIRLTARGARLYRRLALVFEDIESAVRQARHASQEIAVLLPETLGLRLLIDRIAAYNASRAGPKVRYSLALKSWEDFLAGDFDVGVCCHVSEEERPEGLSFRFLRAEALTPLCAPALRSSLPAEPAPSDLARLELLHPFSDKADWKKWLTAAGATGVDAEGGQSFLSMELAVRAAAQGHGVAIADITLFGDEVASGRLMAPFDLVVTEDTGYFLFGRPDRLDEPHISAFCDWLVRAAGPEPAAGAG